MYGKGKGVPQDHNQAYVWCSIAVANGAKSEAKSRDMAASELIPAALQEAQAAALFKKISGSQQ